MRGGWLLVVVGCALACGSSSGGADADGGFTSDGDADPDDPSLTPELPNLLPCPDGWREESTAGTTHCLPWPESGRQECPEGQLHLPGRPGCEAIGTACPAGQWPTGLPGDRTLIYVDPSAAGQMDGSEAKPFAEMNDALAVAPDDAVIVLAKGTHYFDGANGQSAPSPYDRPLTLWGACPVGTLLTSADGSTNPAVTAEVEVRNASIDGIYFLVQSGTLTIRDVHYLPASTFSVSGSTAAAHVIHSRLDASIWAQSGATISLEGVETNKSVRIMGTVTASLEQVSIHSDRSTVGKTGDECDLTSGVFADQGTVTGAQVVIEAVEGLGVRAHGRGTIELSHAYITATEEMTADSLMGGGGGICGLGDHDSLFGFGVEVRAGGAAALRRSTIAANRGVAIRARDPHSSVEVGAGVCPISSMLNPARIYLEDVVVADTDSHVAAGDYGRGISAECGGEITGARVAVHRNRDVGLYSYGRFSRISLTDVTVADTMVQSCEEVEFDSCAWAATSSISASVGGAITLDRFLLDNSALIGVQVAGGGSIELSNGTVSNNPIGANIHDPEYDTSSLQDNVLWLNNTTALDAEELAVPEPEVDLGSL